MDNPVLIQALVTIISAIITGIFGIFIARIQSSSSKSPKASASIILPEGVSLKKTKKPSVHWFAIFAIFTILGGIVGYFYISQIIIFPEPTATAIAEDAISIQQTQTAIASPAFLEGKINPDFPSPIYVRSYPGLPDNNSNIVGSVKPGDSIIVIGWTSASWTWYQIDVPSRNIKGAWISGKILISNSVYDSVIFEGNISILPSSLFVDSVGTTTP